jgi:hypothetical protein
MLTLLLYAAIFLVGLVTGAYSHKWLAKETGAPANLTVKSVSALVEKPAVKPVAAAAAPPAAKV